MKILYIVNNDSPTSIPLEVASKIDQKLNDFKTIVYYQKPPVHKNSFIEDVTHIDAAGPFDVKGWKKALGLLKLYKPDVIHTHHTWSAFLFFILAKISCRHAKLIKTVHHNHDDCEWPQAAFNFLILWMADTILCNSEATLKSFTTIEKKVTKGKAEVCYNGVNLVPIKESTISKEKEEQIAGNISNKLIIGSVGRFVKQKNYQTLIGAFGILKKKKKNINTKLLLIGDGKLKPELEKQVYENKLSKDVIFTGTLDRTSVFGLLKKMDVFVMPSISEGFCNALVEAMAAEKAIICSDIPVLREVADDAVLFAKPESPISFAQNINRLLADNNLFNNMGKRAGRRAKKFSLDTCAEKYMEQY